jgi:nucleotide-binding universal stress UspA family protein
MKILVATDGSSHSKAALQAAVNDFRRESLQVAVVSIAPLPVAAMDGFALSAMSYAPVDIQSLCDANEARAKACLEEARAMLEAAGIQATYYQRTGDPADEILNLAAQQQPDVVIMGSHGRGAIERLFLGSVSDAILRRWSGTTMIVRRPSEAPLEAAPAPAAEASR